MRESLKDCGIKPFSIDVSKVENWIYKYVFIM